MHTRQSARKPAGQHSFLFDFFWISSLLMATFLASCGKETLDSFSPSFNYFPTAKGTFVVFDVDSVVHSTDDNGNDDSVYYYHYQVKEVIDTPFIDGEGHTRQVLVRYYRQDSSQAWNINAVWSQLLTSAYAYRWESNVPYHKMSFPINSEIEWNGNDMNTHEEEMYYYDDIHVSHSYGAVSFDSTVTVIQRDDNNYIERIYAKEVYAAGVGLVYRQRDDLRKTAGVVVSGTEFTMVVREYGVE